MPNKNNGLLAHEGRIGEHIAMTAKTAIEKAAKHNRNVQLRFNDVALTVNKRMSVKHVVRTWESIVHARRLRYRNSPEGRAAKAKRDAEIAEKQRRLDALMLELPDTKEKAMPWIASYVPLADDVKLDGRRLLVVEALKKLGFTSGQHVGDPDLKLGTATRLKKSEYIAGQLISMIESVGCVHPMIGEWAGKTDD